MTSESYPRYVVKQNKKKNKFYFINKYEWFFEKEKKSTIFKEYFKDGVGKSKFCVIPRIVLLNATMVMVKLSIDVTSMGDACVGRHENLSNKERLIVITNPDPE